MAGGEPDFADEDVGQGLRVATGGDFEIRAFRLGRAGFEGGLPLAAGAAGDGGGVARKADAHFLSGIGLAPDDEGFVPLDDHVVAEKMRKGELGGGLRVGKETEGGEGEAVEFHEAMKVNVGRREGFT